MGMIMTKEGLSKLTSASLDIIGFDHQRIQERIHSANKCSRAKDISTKCITKDEAIEKIYVGSIREGIGMDYSNDIDILQINHAVICCHGNTTTQNDKLRFKMEQKRAPAGYTLLKLVRKDSDSATYESLKYAVVKKKRGEYLSSKLYITSQDDVFKYGNGVISKQTRYRSPNGPSIPRYVEENWIQKYGISIWNLTNQDMDFVRAFPCEADEILNAWKNRNRKSGWPSQDIIDKIMSMPVYVVPVGKEGSINEDLQWRISFTMAEIHLIQAFSNTQSKVLVLMKLIAKHILQPLCTGITSYVVKTVMLWQAESIPQEEYSEENLLSRLIDALAFLKTAVENKKLTCYMIPEKNLLDNKITRKEQRKVLRKLTFLQVNGQKLVYDFFNASICNRNRINEIICLFYKSNFIDKVQTRILFCFTTEELANYFTKMYTYGSWWRIYLYNFTFIFVPYYLKYGQKGFDPVDFQLEIVTSAEDPRHAQAFVKVRPFWAAFYRFFSNVFKLFVHSYIYKIY
ncbi:uncharacterized protein LOC132749822 [Ruditapes philippinarum]|uniref:uncharacterized protein LOC132749822 n=1 Tax=Ruditapes philippinarum TaxID=129788 RepID=UPI00295A94FA|nr:uncharacterized protein LOC132749822 [Ruditapes philippinarum]